MQKTEKQTTQGGEGTRFPPRAAALPCTTRGRHASSPQRHHPRGRPPHAARGCTTQTIPTGMPPPSEAAHRPAHPTPQTCLRRSNDLDAPTHRRQPLPRSLTPPARPSPPTKKVPPVIRSGADEAGQPRLCREARVLAPRELPNLPPPPTTPPGRDDKRPPRTGRAVAPRRA